MSSSVNTSHKKFDVIFVLGGPGAGKGTQCSKIVEEYGFIHLSAGDLLRAEQKNPNSEYGKLIEGHMVNGTIVPVSITCALLARAMDESGKDKFLIDGFPRNKDNVDGWNLAMSDKVNLKFVLFFDCSDEICIERCMSRGAAGSGRSDDNIETLKKRLVTFRDSSIGVIQNFDKVEKINAAQNQDEVFTDVKKCFDKYYSS